MTYAVATFYRFLAVEDLERQQRELADLCGSEGLFGTILLAGEGVNGTVAGPAEGLARLLDELTRRFAIDPASVKHSQADALPFRRMRVRIRPEIITLRAPDADPTRRTGRHVGSDEWNDLLRDPGVLVLDTRNHYETEVGTFRGATVPHLDSFTDFKTYVDGELDPAVHKRVAMFCTGGIRCEKASSYMLARGFQDVVQLDGGILRYLEDMPADRSLWEGDCYVFDSRTALGAGLVPTRWQTCFGCGGALDEAARARPEFEDGVSCHRCRQDLSEQRARDLRRRHALRVG